MDELGELHRAEVFMKIESDEAAFMAHCDGSRGRTRPQWDHVNPTDRPRHPAFRVRDEKERQKLVKTHRKILILLESLAEA